MELNKKYSVLLMDAANTVIHKPSFWPSFQQVLAKRNLQIDVRELKAKHKLLSEIIEFPDKTSAKFYANFNSELLLSLGIIPDENLIEDIFKSCSYLAWESFEDTFSLNQLPIKKVILSNFNITIEEKIVSIFGDLFDRVIGSEKEGLRKPSVHFYKKALEMLQVLPEKVLYVGDSLKLDVIPAQKAGMDVLLIDREGNYPNFEHRIVSLKQLETMI